MEKIIYLPLAKVRVPSSMSQTRGIANISHLAKIMERSVVDQLVKYLEDIEFFDRFQSGYRKNFSTQTALLNITDDIRHNMESGFITIIVLFDFSKAFDMIDHRTLLEVLAQVGVSTNVLKWLNSYLSGRTQAVVKEDGTLTRFIPTTCGVPQGSVLGPILFLIYINSISKSVRKCKHHIFVDDFQIRIKCRVLDIIETLKDVQSDIMGIERWATRNKLALNAKKNPNNDSRVNYAPESCQCSFFTTTYCFR